MLNDYRRAVIGCLGLYALSFVLIGCSNKDADAPNATAATGGAAAGAAATNTQADATSQNGAPGKASAIAGPRVDPAPKGVETGNYQGGMK
jgi:hypothetical protein